MTSGEKRAWLAFLRQHWPPGPPSRKGLLELADILELQWFGQRRGRRSISAWTSWQVANFNIRGWGHRREIKHEMEGMETRGEQPRRDVAEEVVADRHRITRRALQNRMRFRKRNSTN